MCQGAMTLENTDREPLMALSLSLSYKGTQPMNSEGQTCGLLCPHSRIVRKQMGPLLFPSPHQTLQGPPLAWVEGRLLISPSLGLESVTGCFPRLASVTSTACHRLFHAPLIDDLISPLFWGVLFLSFLLASLCLNSRTSRNPPWLWRLFGKPNSHPVPSFCYHPMNVIT